MPAFLAFTPQSPTFARTVTVASTTVVPAFSPAPSAAQVSILGAVDYRFVVIGTQAVWLAYALPGSAAPTAAIPADGAEGTGIMLEPSSSHTLAFPYGTQFAAIAASVGSSIYATVGAGVAL